jgi:hypothetical protein
VGPAAPFTATPGPFLVRLPFRSTMFLIQILLPLTGSTAQRTRSRAAFDETRRELVEAFGGITAYSQAPAEGVWTAADGGRALDTVIMVEVVTRAFDRAWWRDYTATLARRFDQETIHVRALSVELLDEDAH